MARWAAICTSLPQLCPPLDLSCVCPAAGQQASPQLAGVSHPSRAERAQRRWEQQAPASEDEDDGSLSDEGDDPDLEAQMQVGVPLCSCWLSVQGPARPTRLAINAGGTLSGCWAWTVYTHSWWGHTMHLQVQMQVSAWTCSGYLGGQGPARLRPEHVGPLLQAEREHKWVVHSKGNRCSML